MNGFLGVLWSWDLFDVVICGGKIGEGEVMSTGRVPDSAGMVYCEGVVVVCVGRVGDGGGF